MPLFEAAFPYQEDVLALPVADIEQAAAWYGSAFGLRECSRHDSPHPAVVMQRDQVKIGFSENGGDPTQDGAAILVTDIHKARQELEAAGVEIGNWRIDERDGKNFQVFFVIAPDGLCYYFHQEINDPLA